MRKRRQSFCWHPLGFLAAIAWEALFLSSATLVALVGIGFEGLEQLGAEEARFAGLILLVGILPGWLLGYVALASIRAPLPLGLWAVIGFLRAFLGSFLFFLFGSVFQSIALGILLLLICFGVSTCLYWLLWNRAYQRGIR
jgi:hypothetical protein